MQIIFLVYFYFIIPLLIANQGLNYLSEIKEIVP